MTQDEAAKKLDALAGHHQGIGEQFQGTQQKDKADFHFGLAAGYANAAGFVREITPAGGK